LHTYVVSYPAGLRRPELVPTGTQTAFWLYETISWEGEKKPDHAWHLYERKGVSVESSSPPLFIGKTQGVVLALENTKVPPLYISHKKESSKKGAMWSSKELHLLWPATPMPPPNGVPSLASFFLLEL
jgi:hypothetical protein